MRKCGSGDEIKLEIQSFRPQSSVQGAILDRLADMVAYYILRASEVGDGAGDF